MRGIDSEGVRGLHWFIRGPHGPHLRGLHWFIRGPHWFIRGLHWLFMGRSPHFRMYIMAHGLLLSIGAAEVSLEAMHCTNWAERSRSRAWARTPTAARTFSLPSEEGCGVEESTAVMM